MAKKPQTGRQPSLFKEDVPQMPEGYYSSGPNPNLHRFVEEHATPYDPATDEYNVPAFEEPITTKKTTAIYNMHGYWSKKPHDAIREYIRHHAGIGDLILDPFCGSGGTALAAILEARNAVAIDLSPAATFITASHLHLPSPSQLRRAVEQLGGAMERFINDNMVFPATGEFVKAIVYTERFRCSRCLESVPFIRAVPGEERRFRGRVSKKECCPFCQEPIRTQEDERLGFVPAELHLAQSPTATRGIRVLDVLGDSRYAELYPVRPKCIPEWLCVPFEGFIPPRLSKNIAKAGVHVVGELYTDLNLRTLLALRTLVSDAAVRQQVKQSLLLALHAILYNSSRMYRHRTRSAGGGGFSGTYYIPHMSKCVSPWASFLAKCRDLERGIGAIQGSLTAGRYGHALVSTESATDFHRLDRIPADSIDYIFTDPPYGGTYQYGALNFVWEVWTQADLSWRAREIVISEDGKITFDDWKIGMRKALEQMYDVLKPGRWMSLCFHGEVELWMALHDVATEVGFIPGGSESTLYVDTVQKSYNQLTGDTSKKRDLIVNFRKPRPGEFTQLVLTFDEDTSTFSEKARAIIRQALDTRPGSPSDRLYDDLVSCMMRRGELARHDFLALLTSVAEEIDGRWYLSETADQVDEGESTKEASAAAHLESFMEEYLAEHPEEVGVHYSDLFEHYLPVQDKPRRLPLDWLPEFFFKTTEGTWRPPKDDEERKQKEVLRTSGALRRIKRFGRALLEGVPPHDRDRPANAATAADWIRQCRRAGLYDIGRVLYEKGGFTFDELGEEGKLEVDEDYQICVRRT